MTQKETWYLDGAQDSGSAGSRNMGQAHHVLGPERANLREVKAKKTVLTFSL